MELVSALLSWPLAFPLFSLTPVLSAPWLAYLSSLRRPPGQKSPVSAQWSQTEREGDLLGPEPGIPRLPQALYININFPEALPTQEAWAFCHLGHI